nr:elongation factor 1-beta [Nanoarchaeum sp.]
MARAVATLKVMPSSPETDLHKLELKVKELIYKFVKEKTETKVEIEPVAFGLKALIIFFVMDEKLGSPDPIAEQVEEFEEVNSAEITDVRRAIG